MSESGRILLISDNEDTSMYLRQKLIIDGGYAVTFESNSRAALEDFQQNNFDAVILKFNMPDLNSVSVVKELRKRDPDAIIIALLEDSDPSLFNEIARIGVYDFLAKPINLEKLFFLLKKGVDLRRLVMAHRKFMQSLNEQNSTLQKQNTLLAKRIEESTKNLTRLYEDLRLTYMRTIKVLAQAIDARDHYTHSHSENVAKYAVVIAEEMRLSAKDVELIRQACELHDLGKIGVQDDILSKASSLTEEEWKEIKRHPVTGAQILEPLGFLEGVISLVRQHHEHYDGAGYPEGRRGEDILLGARIIHLADAYEAMRSARSYRKVPLSKEAAIAEIKLKNGTQFDPQVVAAFLKVVDTID